MHLDGNWCLLKSHAVKDVRVSGCMLQGIERGPSGEVTGLTGELHLEGNFKTTKLKLTWLPVTRDLVPLELHDFDHLLTKKKLEEADSFEEFINPCSVRLSLQSAHMAKVITGATVTPGGRLFFS